MYLSKFAISMLSMEKWEKEGVCSRESQQHDIKQVLKSIAVELMHTDNMMKGTFLQGLPLQRPQHQHNH